MSSDIQHIKQPHNRLDVRKAFDGSHVWLHMIDSDVEYVKDWSLVGLLARRTTSTNFEMTKFVKSVEPRID